MEERRKIIASDLENLWVELRPDFATGYELHNYHVDIQIDVHTIQIDMSSSPGGGFEGGYGSTSIKTGLVSNPEFEFAIYPEDFLNRIGKFFGMEDVVLGYEEFDHKVIIKTNNTSRLQSIFADVETRKALQQESGYAFKLEHDEEKASYILELEIQRAITDLDKMAALITMYHKVLHTIDPV